MSKMVKASDLMLGNWVIITKDCGIPKSEIIKVTSRVIDEVDNGILQVAPIPLTRDILIKNGFKVTKNLSSSCNKDMWSIDNISVIEHHNKKEFPYFWADIGHIVDVRYIHQLQNLIKFAGSKKEITLSEELLSFRPQNTWKPSDEQMKALHDINLTGNISYAGQGQVLIELYNDLKKLKGE